ncbi:MAG: hypothetical protein IJ219_01560 [Bacteroidaceae bacterium]|nr:hypothetical protein [Bacteroidaceae bacterium]MBQ9293600.1 hypothetical protein [Bacteroidaceae bacterium]
MESLKGFLCLSMATLLCIGSFAQENLTLAQKKPRQNEKVLVQNAATANGYNSVQTAYNGALREAKTKFAGKSVDVRNLAKGEVYFTSDGMAANYYNYTIVELPDATTLALSMALTKALAEVEEDSKFAINKIVITSEDVDKAKIKGEVIDLLNKKGHKVVAKEYLEKLYAEQQTSKSETFNQKTAVKGNNFSATGYYINISITDDYLQAQIINVSTGEYDGNAIVNF